MGNLMFQDHARDIPGKMDNQVHTEADGARRRLPGTITVAGLADGKERRFQSQAILPVDGVELAEKLPTPQGIIGGVIGGWRVTVHEPYRAGTWWPPAFFSSPAVFYGRRGPVGWGDGAWG